MGQNEREALTEIDTMVPAVVGRSQQRTRQNEREALTEIDTHQGLGGAETEGPGSSE
jgi:hypothetical protein